MRKNFNKDYSHKRDFKKNNKYKQQIQQPLPEKRDFNDVFDVLSDQFTPVEKLTGIASLPFNPVLHPIKTVKGVFETYNKLASIPLAVYSGNIDKISGIVSGDEEFSGKDVIGQMEGDPEIHGIIPSLEGLALDIATDPFIGAVRLPEEMAKLGNQITLQAAAPGLPQAFKQLGAHAWITRWTGVGLGKDAKGVMVKQSMELPAHERAAALDELSKQQEIIDSHKAQLESLQQDIKTTKENPIHIPTAEGKDTIYINSPKNFIEGQFADQGDYVKNIYRESGQSEIDYKELQYMGSNQREHKSLNTAIDHFSELVRLTEEGKAMKVAQEAEELKINQDKAAFWKELQDWGMNNPGATESQINEKEMDLLVKYTSQSDVGFHVSDAVNLYFNRPVHDIPVYRYLKKDTAGLPGKIKTYGKLTIEPSKSGKTVKMINDGFYIDTPLGPVPTEKFWKNPAKYNMPYQDNIEIFEKYLYTPISEFEQYAAEAGSNTKLKTQFASTNSISEKANVEVNRLSHFLFESPEESWKGLNNKNPTVEEFSNWLDNADNDIQKSLRPWWQMKLEMIHTNIVDSLMMNQYKAHLKKYGIEAINMEHFAVDEDYARELAEHYMSYLDGYDLKRVSLMADNTTWQSAYDTLFQPEQAVVKTTIPSGRSSQITNRLTRNKLIEREYGGTFKVKKPFVIAKGLKPKFKLYTAYPQEVIDNFYHQLISSNAYTFFAETHPEISNSLDELFKHYSNGNYGKFRSVLMNDVINPITNLVANENKRAKDLGLEVNSLMELLDHEVQKLDEIGKSEIFQIFDHWESIAPNWVFEGANPKLPEGFSDMFRYEQFTTNMKISNYLDDAGVYAAKQAKLAEEAKALEAKGVSDLLPTAKVAEVKEVAEVKQIALKEATKIKSISDSPIVKIIPAKDLAERFGNEHTQRRLKELYTELAKTESNLDEAIETMTTLEGQYDAMISAHKLEVDKMVSNLNAMQLESFVQTRRDTVSAFTEHYKKIEQAMMDIEDYAYRTDKGKAKKIIYKLQAHSIKQIYKDKKVILEGKTLLRDLMNSNFTLAGHFNPKETKQLQDLADRLNEDIGIEGLFKLRSPGNPNPSLRIFELDRTLIYAEKGKHNEAVLKRLSEFIKANKETEFPRVELDASYKGSIAKLNETEQSLVDNLGKARLETNQKLKEFAEMAGLGDQFGDIEGYFPHSLVNYKGDRVDEIVRSGGIVSAYNSEIANKLKRELGMTGTLSSSASAKAIVGNPLEFEINIINGDRTITKKKMFSINHKTAYSKALSSAFANHERLRITQDILLNEANKVSNLNIVDLPHEAIASTDILIPVYNKKKLVKFRKYAPTPANVEKYAQHGYMVDKTVSSEIRTMLMYENTIAQSTGAKWMMTNIIHNFKNGVLLNLGFPLGNGGDMWFKTLSSTPFKDWGHYHKNLASAWSSLSAHENHMRAYATVKEATGALHNTSYYEYLNDMHEFLNNGKKASWMTQEVETHLSHRLTQVKEGTPVLQDLNKAIAYEMYTALPTATTNYREALQAINNEAEKKGKDIDFTVWLKNVYQSKLGKALSYVSTDNFMANNFHKFNEKLENMMRFTDMMTQQGQTIGAEFKAVSIDQQWMSNELLKFNHMHFSEMPGDAVWLSAIMPFWQFPVKNAVWWGKFIAKKPQFAAQISRVKKSFWDDDSDSFWAKLGSLPLTDNLVLRGIPGLGSYQSFAMGLDSPVDMFGNRLSPIIRPFTTTDGKKYKAYSFDRQPHEDNLLKAWLHGMNPIEGNIQYGLNLVSGDEALPARLTPSLVRENREYNKKNR